MDGFVTSRLEAQRNLALLAGTRIAASVAHPTGGGARDPQVLLSDRAQHLDGLQLDQFERRYTFDTYDGQNRTHDQDAYTVTFAQPVRANYVEMTMGFAYPNGGWWTSLGVEYLDESGAWCAASDLTITPPYCFENVRGERRPYQTHVLSFGPVETRALRLIGWPGGQDEFTSLARIAVGQQDVLHARTAVEISPAPLPDIFRAISPATVWDLSIGLYKVTGVLINLPLMEFYLDSQRSEQRWQVLRRTYQGEPELWFLMGDAMGWDAWNETDPVQASAASPASEDPHVHLIMDGALARPVAPVVAAGRLLGSLTTHPVIVRDHFRWSWHRRYARQANIPWEAYSAAVRRSPQLTMEQLGGIASLIGLIANSVATLAYRLDRAEQDLERTASRHKQIVLQAIAFMRDHLEETIGVADVARAVALSPHYFSDLFTEQTGFTPNEFLTNLRIERAKEYLTTTSMSPTDVCLTLGYSSSYFWRLFKRRTGYTPAHFATRNRAHTLRS